MSEDKRPLRPRTELGIELGDMKHAGPTPAEKDQAVSPKPREEKRRDSDEEWDKYFEFLGGEKEVPEGKYRSEFPEQHTSGDIESLPPDEIEIPYREPIGYWRSLIEGLTTYRQENGRILGEDNPPALSQLITADTYMRRRFPHLASSYELASMLTDGDADTTYLSEKLRTQRNFLRGIQKTLNQANILNKDDSLQLKKSRYEFINGLKSVWHKYFAAPIADSIVGSDGRSSKTWKILRTIPVVLFGFIRASISTLEYGLRYSVAPLTKFHRYSVGLTQKLEDYKRQAREFYRLSEAPEVIAVLKTQLELDGTNDEKAAYQQECNVARDRGKPEPKPNEVQGEIVHSKKAGKRLQIINIVLNIFIKTPIDTIAHSLHYANILVFDTISGIAQVLKYPGSGAATNKFRRVRDAVLNILPLALVATPFIYFAIHNPAELANLFTGTSIASSTAGSIAVSIFVWLALPLLCRGLQYGTGRMMVAIVDRERTQQEEAERLSSKTPEDSKRSGPESEMERRLARKIEFSLNSYHSSLSHSTHSISSLTSKARQETQNIRNNCRDLTTTVGSIKSMADFEKFQNELTAQLRRLDTLLADPENYKPDIDRDEKYSPSDAKGNMNSLTATTTPTNLPTFQSVSVALQDNKPEEPIDGAVFAQKSGAEIDRHILSLVNNDRSQLTEAHFVPEIFGIIPKSDIKPVRVEKDGVIHEEEKAIERFALTGDQHALHKYILDRSEVYKNYKANRQIAIQADLAEFQAEGKAKAAENDRFTLPESKPDGGDPETTQLLERKRSQDSSSSVPVEQINSNSFLTELRRESEKEKTRAIQIPSPDEVTRGGSKILNLNV